MKTYRFQFIFQDPSIEQQISWKMVSGTGFLSVVDVREYRSVRILVLLIIIFEALQHGTTWTSLESRTAITTMYWNRGQLMDSDLGMQIPKESNASNAENDFSALACLRGKPILLTMYTITNSRNNIGNHLRPVEGLHDFCRIAFIYLTPEHLPSLW